MVVVVLTADDEERELRIELMKTQIDKGRLDMRRIEQEMRWEPWRAFAAFATGVAAVSGIILAVAHLLHP